MVSLGRRGRQGEGLIDVPVRFGLAGRVTLPEARASVALENERRTVVPARPLLIR